MTRDVSRVAREIADELKERRLEFELVELTGGPLHSIPHDTLQRWLLLLAPKPRKVRSKPSKNRATVKELDALCRAVVFQRDGETCRKCGKPAVDWSHCYTRRIRSIRWDLDNSWASCKGCHLDWHHRPLEGAEWWQKELGPIRYQALVLRAAKPRKTDLGLVKVYLENERKKVGGKDV